MPLAAIGMGANLGDREGTLRLAVERLSRLGQVQAVSSFYDTEPVGYADQPRFLNAAALLETAMQPLELLHGLLEIEQALGRDRSHGIVNGPRTLDLDLLLFGEEEVRLPGLTVPHPEMHLRRFVLEPLAEIAPQMRHPVQGVTIRALLARLY